MKFSIIYPENESFYFLAENAAPRIEIIHDTVWIC